MDGDSVLAVQAHRPCQYESLEIGAGPRDRPEIVAVRDPDRVCSMIGPASSSAVT